MVPGQLPDLIKGLIRDHGASLLQGLAAQLAEPALRAQVVSGILGGVDHFLDSMGPMGAIARGFLERDALEQKVIAYLEEKEEDLAAWLGNPEVQERMTAALAESVDGLLRKPLSELLAGVDEARLDSMCRECAAQLLAVFKSEGALLGMSALLHVGMEELLDGGRRSLGDLGKQFPDDNGAMLRDSRQCVALFRSRKTKRLVSGMLKSMIDALLARPIGMLYNLVPHGIRRAVNDAVVLAANRVLLQETPGVVDSLNLKQMVTDKINSLDLLQLERLLLSIMEEQFKYINLFGAILGFFMGLINLALVEFM